MQRLTSRRLLQSIVLAIVLLGVMHAAGGQALWAASPRSEHDARMRWWRDAKFGMFIHWGAYAVPAGEYHGKRVKGAGEWIMENARIPRSEYEGFAKRLNPVRFDAAEWVAIAKDAGMRYIVITSKHHDGFSMFDSKVSDYTITKATPFRRDPLAELSRECKQGGIKFCVYHSIMDWHHPAQQKNAKGSYNPTQMAPGAKAEYVKYMKGQLREITERYDPAVLWFDGEWCDWWTEEDGKDLVKYLRSLKPDVILNNRIGKGRAGMEGFSKDATSAGDFGTPEQQIPATGLPGVDWESCMTMNDTWGYDQYDQRWKSAPVLIQNLVDIASKGGNFLLNVGPKADGTIPPESVERLAVMGKWMKTNGESIYGTSASPFDKVAWGRVTQKPGKLYLHVFQWADYVGQRLDVPDLKNQVKTAYMLADASRAPLQVTRSDEKLWIKAPASTAGDPVDTVVVLEIAGAAQPVEKAAAK